MCPREAFASGIRCLATLASGIPRRDSPYGHSLLRNILAMKLQMFPIFIKNYP
jgi:hypothetical protein